MCASVDEICEAIALSELAMVSKNGRLWTEEEDAILRRLHGHMLDSEIADILERTEIAVTLRWKRDLHLPPPTTDPDYLTTLKIARALGVDGHKTPTWVHRGILKGEYIPRRDGKPFCRVKRTDFITWLQDPQSWVWFDIANIRDPELYKIVQEALAAWGDDWWTTNQVAAYHGVNNKDVLRYIKQGKIQARHVTNIGGRGRASWAYWFVLKSEATRKDLAFVRRAR